MPIRLTKTVKVLAIICFIVFLIQQTGDQFFGTHLTSVFGLVPAYWLRDYRIWQLFTYSFLHADVMQLFFNLMMMTFIGSDLEDLWGPRRFLRFYLFCATATGLVYLLFQMMFHGPGNHAPLIGPSGAIYGLLMAYGLLFGERVLLFMMLFPLKAKYFIWVLALIQLMTTVYSPGGGWSSLAHLSGMASGLIYLWIQASWLASRKNPSGGGFFAPAKRRKRSKHLKLIVNNNRDFDSQDDDDPGPQPKVWH
jgi:membrane associated rhomboid family serine protease